MNEEKERNRILEGHERSTMILDLLSRIPYNQKVRFYLRYGDNGHKEGWYDGILETLDNTGRCCEITYFDGGEWYRDWTADVEDVRPYLRSLSDMTDAERKEYNEFEFIYASHFGFVEDAVGLTEWLYSHGFDVHNFIPRNLAIEEKR